VLNTPYTRHKAKRNKTKNTAQYVLNTPYTRHMAKTNKTKIRTQYVLNIPYTRHKAETNKAKKYKAMCVGHHYAQTNTNNVNKT